MSTGGSPCTTHPKGSRQIVWWYAQLLRAAGIEVQDRLDDKLPGFWVRQCCERVFLVEQTLILGHPISPNYLRDTEA
jgi:hypothetical protein